MLPIKRLASLALNPRQLSVLPPSSASAVFFSYRAKSTLASTIKKMGVERTIIQEGSGATPNPGDQVTIEYTGWLSNNGEKGTQ